MKLALSKGKKKFDKRAAEKEKISNDHNNVAMMTDCHLPRYHTKRIGGHKRIIVLVWYCWCCTDRLGVGVMLGIQTAPHKKVKTWHARLPRTPQNVSGFTNVS